MKKKSTLSPFLSMKGKFKIYVLALFTFLFTGFSLQTNAQCGSQYFTFSDSLNPSMIFFNDVSTGGPDSIISWMWDFGDGSTSTVSNPTHIYSAPGTYLSCLIISTNTGCMDTSCVPVTIPNLNPSITISDFSNDSTGTIFCTAPANTDFILSGQTTGFSLNDSVNVQVFNGDGTDTIFKLSIQQMYFFAYWSHVYQNAGTYTPTVIVSLNGYADTMSATTITVNSNCGPLSGTVYLDNNLDCIFNSGDETLANISVSLSVAGVTVAWAYTDSNGVYSFNVPSGTTYDVTVHTNNWHGGTYTVTCPSSGTLSVSTVPSSGNDFFLACPTGFDLTGSATLSGIVPGRTGSVCVFAYDRFCSTPSGQIKVILDPMLTALPDSSGNYTISGDTIIWNYSSSTSYWSFCASVFTATTATIGDTACVTMIIEPISGDANPADNTVTACAAVRTSYDPNDKNGEPYGVGLNNAILPGTEINYTIRFQNTGTAEAYDIYILDSLDQNFDINSLEILASSHAMVPSILQDNVLRFTFSNIMLPDSNSNEPMSHGYVKYRITPSSGVADGTILTNTAGIYFDYNPVVITNTTNHMIDYTLGFKQIEKAGGIQISPNPSNENVLINVLQKGTYKFQLINILGEVVFTSNLIQDQIRVNTSKLPAGVYIVKAEDGKQVFQSRLIINH